MSRPEQKAPEYTDADLHRLQKNAFAYFLHETDASTGLVRDSTHVGSPASIAADLRLPSRGAGGPACPTSAPPSASSLTPPRIRNTNSANRSGTRCSGVPVITSTPKPASSASSGIAAHVVSSAWRGAEITNPIRPPDDCIAPTPDDGPGLPSAMCTIPSAPSRKAVQPITIRPACAFLSGCRSSRQASSASRTGSVHDPIPNVPRISAVSPRPTGEPSRHHAVLAAMMAAASAASPAPSLRCAGSSSRALSPNSRATYPTLPAISIQTAATALTIQPMMITRGLLDPRIPRAEPRRGGVGVLRLR